jgi:hypothetical protein
MAAATAGRIPLVAREAEPVEGSRRRFGEALRPLLEDREEFLTKTGNINFRAVANALDGVHYETLRKAAAGDRVPPLHVIEQVAALLGVSPDYFAEYALARVSRDFDVREVGWDQAIENLRAWSEIHAAQPKRK